jgi:hypothetical protein
MTPVPLQTVSFPCWQTRTTLDANPTPTNAQLGKLLNLQIVTKNPQTHKKTFRLPIVLVNIYVSIQLRG